MVSNLKLTTVTQLVDHLISVGIRFSISEGGYIRTLGEGWCPLCAVEPYSPGDPYRRNGFAATYAHHQYGMDYNVGSEIVSAADDMCLFDPKVRTELMRLVR